MRFNVRDLLWLTTCAGLLIVAGRLYHECRNLEARDANVRSARDADWWVMLDQDCKNKVAEKWYAAGGGMPGN